MPADFNKVITTEAYATLMATITDLVDALSQGLDPAVVTPLNVPTSAVRWNSVNGYWEKFSGAAWAPLAATYAINIAGSASKWATGRTITIGGDASGTSGAWDGSGNLSFNIALATVTAAKGGTGQTSYTVGDMLYASGAATLSKLVDVAAGNVLLSGGVGAAPSYGKVGLSTHISGVLGTGNGGTGATTVADARANLGVPALASANTFSGSNTFTAKQTINTNGVGVVLEISDTVSGGGASIWMTGNGTAPSKQLRVRDSNFEVVNSTNTQIIMALNDAGYLNITGAIVATNVSGTNTGDEPYASTNAEGVVRLSSDAEAKAGAVSVAVQPSNLAAVVLGIGQTHQNVTASRAVDTVYTNSTGRAIFVSITGLCGACAHLNVNGAEVARSALNASVPLMALSAIVPAGATYQLTRDSGAGVTLWVWDELR